MHWQINIVKGVLDGVFFEKVSVLMKFFSNIVFFQNYNSFHDFFVSNVKFMIKK